MTAPQNPRVRNTTAWKKVATNALAALRERQAEAEAAAMEVDVLTAQRDKAEKWVVRLLTLLIVSVLGFLAVVVK